MLGLSFKKYGKKSMSNNNNLTLKTDEKLMHISISQRFFIVPILILFAASILAQITSLDTMIANEFYDFGNKSWLGDNTWWANTLIHDWGRYLIALILLSSFTVFITSFLIQDKLKKYRRVTAYLCLCIVLTTSLVGLGKKYSNVDCPRDLNRYGGNQPYVHVFSAKPSSYPSGRCFPGGHSSGAFSLYALYFISLLLLPRHARKVFITVTLLGLTYGLGQWARGSHFVIHDIWSAAVGWYISLGLFYMLFQYRYKTVLKKH